MSLIYLFLLVTNLKKAQKDIFHQNTRNFLFADNIFKPILNHQHTADDTVIFHYLQILIFKGYVVAIFRLPFWVYSTTVLFFLVCERSHAPLETAAGIGNCDSIAAVS